MKTPRLPKLIRLCAWLIKGFCTVCAVILVFGVVLGVFGASENAQWLLTTMWPWLLRGVILLGCAIAVTSFTESM